MADLNRVLALLAQPQATRFVRGVVVAPASGSTGYSLNINGSALPASCADNVAVAAGDPVLCVLIDSGRGGAEAIILCRLSTSGIHPATGTVTSVPGGSNTIVVTGTDGMTYNAYAQSGYTPAVNDNVDMVFLAGVPYATKAIATPSATVSQPITSQGSGPSTGTTPFTASDSATFWATGGWGSWGNQADVYEGTWNGSTVHGAWWYGGGPTQLAGRTIAAARFTFGARIGGSGNYNAPASVNIWTHSASSRPSQFTDVTLLNGPTTVTIQPYASPTVTLSAAQAADLVNGGGIAIFGGDYAAFQGVQANAASGQLAFDWSR
ncbi:hypothetical protein SPF06_01105 [Sinomonas sp. JGH33]|uniref:Minor tail protein n=1 Tax=Sinomonas terricola TaxID=3110330 RepID=A0ABU5T0Z1_9MICC|nr:hypothetical protein [Sinomonas sp. JGH33]MEA5453309.1 hypothetical protein [Sinomonas sp. JGH33]